MKGLHHLHLRKRLSGRLEPFPARRSHLRVLDGIVLFAGTVGPLMTIPQIIKIYAFQNAAGISLVSWGMYALLDIPWVVYGIAHRERAIVFTYSLWIIMNSLVFFGALAFGADSF